jgi:hypothetical protein
MYVNAKMKPVETVPGIRGGKMGESSGGGDSPTINLLHFKILYKCCSVLPPSTTKTKK